jgi:hypothetical protein
MQRFPAFDPPEYVSWRPDAALSRLFRETIASDPQRAAVIARLSPDDLLAIYAGLVRARLHDVTLKRWVRTGVISKAWLGTGEEAATVGPVQALERGRDVVAPMIRNAAACCELGLPVADMLRAYLGSADAPSGGRDLHVGAWAQGVLQPISLTYVHGHEYRAGIQLIKRLAGGRPIGMNALIEASSQAYRKRMERWNVLVAAPRIAPGLAVEEVLRLVALDGIR